VSLKILSIGEREELLRQGLTDRDAGVKKVVEKELGQSNASFFNEHAFEHCNNIPQSSNGLTC
jgi:hypothetical protein